MGSKKYPILFAIIAVLVVANGALYVTGQQINGGPGGPGEAQFNWTEGVPPTWSDLEQSEDSADPGEIIVFSVTLEDNTGLKSASLNMSIDGSDWTITETQQISGTSSFVVFRYTVPNYIPGTRIKWNIVVFDTSGNKAITNTKDVIVSDTIPPEIVEQTQEEDDVVIGGTLLLEVRVSDNYRVGSVVFEANETGRFEEVAKYNFTTKDVVTSIRWANKTLIKEGTFVGWRVVAKDTWGNTRASDIMVFKVRGCPVCPADSEWSDCEQTGTGEWRQIQLYYDCSSFTNFTCVLSNRSQNCTPGITKAQAKSAINEATAAIILAKEENRNIWKAENLLTEAQEAENAGKWDDAYAKALEAKEAAETAEVIEKPGPNYLPYVVVVLIIIGAMWILLRFGKIHLPVAQKFTPPEEAKATKPGAGQICGVCGKRFSRLYRCEDCGTMVCYDDARTWQGKIYCVSCLRKKGLI